MTRGEGCLFVATRAGAAVADVRARPIVREAGPTWWGLHCAVAWTAAWLKLRGRTLLGPRELLDDDTWLAELHYSARHGDKQTRHRPALVAQLSGANIGIEVEATYTSPERLRAILGQHAVWYAAGQTNGVMYVCHTAGDRERLDRAGEHVGLSLLTGRPLRIELLETIRAQAAEAGENPSRST